MSIPGHHSGDEELGAIGVFARICHAKQPLFGVLQLEVLVLKLVSVDGLPSGAISVCKVATLNHERLDDPVEG